MPVGTCQAEAIAILLVACFRIAPRQTGGVCLQCTDAIGQIAVVGRLRQLDLGRADRRRHAAARSRGGFGGQEVVDR